MIKNPFIRQLLNSCMDLAPILAVILIFQIFIIREPIPDVGNLLVGTLFVIFGLTLFVQGLEQSLFPIGESMAYAFARKGSVFWLMAFAFCLGFGAAIAEPGLASVSEKAANIAISIHRIEAPTKAIYAMSLRITVAVSIGLAIMVGVLRIIKGWSLHYPVFLGYICVAAMTPFAPNEIVGIAYDAGGIATSSITVPLVIVLGVGLATAIKGRNPLTDGFGLVVFATLMATIFVLSYGIIL